MSGRRIDIPEAIPPKDERGMEEWLRRLRMAVALLAEENEALRVRVAELEKTVQEEN
jgi:hypothetical protein